MKIIKLTEEHYIIVDDSEIKEGDTWYNASTGLWWKVTADNVAMYNQPSNMDRNGLNKITHSTQPLKPIDFANSTDAEQVSYFDFVKGYASVKYIPLQEVKELIGEVGVEKKARKFLKSKEDFDNATTNYWIDFLVEFYNQALEDNKEKKYTEEDVIRIVEKSRETGLTAEYLLLSIQPKTEWEVEFVDGKIKLI